MTLVKRLYDSREMELNIWITSKLVEQTGNKVDLSTLKPNPIYNSDLLATQFNYIFKDSKRMCNYSQKFNIGYDKDNTADTVVTSLTKDDLIMIVSPALGTDFTTTVGAIFFHSDKLNFTNFFSQIIESPALKDNQVIVMSKRAFWFKYRANETAGQFFAKNLAMSTYLHSWINMGTILNGVGRMYTLSNAGTKFELANAFELRDGDKNKELVAYTRDGGTTITPTTITQIFTNGFKEGDAIYTSSGAGTWTKSPTGTSNLNAILEQYDNGDIILYSETAKLPLSALNVPKITIPTTAPIIGKQLVVNK